MELKKILVVDDEAPLREILQRGLTQMGEYSVELAQNGQEAIDKIEKEIFDLILTDLMMPEMDGMELLKIIKGTRPEMPVIMMTAYGSIDTAVEAMKIGANDYITKPVDFRDLLLRISKVD
ncbi:MAG: response regulator, partial [Deltaproteobacteria bacterium]|nr:response regulator [Deltaproteobacteria bacterium]